MKTSRQRILEYVRVHRAVTTSDICMALKTSEANVRHHLAILISNNLVQVIGERPVIGKGRPRRIFGPAEATLGSHLGLLAEALLSEVMLELKENEKEAVYDRIAQRMKAYLEANDLPNVLSLRKAPAGATPQGEGVSARLVAAVLRLNTAHYQARWEARPDAPQLILGHCPFQPLPSKYPEICRLDAHLLERLTGNQVEQIDRLARDERGTAYCRFRIHPLLRIE